MSWISRAYELRPAARDAGEDRRLRRGALRGLLGRDLLCVFESEDTVRAMAPDMEKLAALDGLLQHATSTGREFDCVSRSFAPKLSVPEDPVCGSGHCHIVPYWLKSLGREKLTAYRPPAAAARSGAAWKTAAST